MRKLLFILGMILAIKGYSIETYMDVNLGAGWIKMPHFSYGTVGSNADISAPNPLFGPPEDLDIRDEVISFLPEVVVGLCFPFEPAPFLRAEIFGSYLDYRKNPTIDPSLGITSDRSFYAPFINDVPSNLFVGRRFISVSNPVEGAYFSRDYSYGRAGLRFLSDYYLSRNVYLTPLLGFTYARLSQSYDFGFATEPQFPSGVFGFRLAEQVDSDIYAIDFGLKATYESGNAFVYIGGGVSPYFIDSEFNGSLFFRVFDAFNPFQFLQDIHMTETAHTWRVKGQAEAGIGYRFKYLEIALKGNAEFYGAIPQIINPSILPGTQLLDGPTRIGYSHLNVYSAQICFKVPFFSFGFY